MRRPLELPLLLPFCCKNLLAMSVTALMPWGVCRSFSSALWRWFGDAIFLLLLLALPRFPPHFLLDVRRFLLVLRRVRPHFLLEFHILLAFFLFARAFRTLFTVAFLACVAPNDRSCSNSFLLVVRRFLLVLRRVRPRFLLDVRRFLLVLRRAWPHFLLDVRRFLLVLRRVWPHFLLDFHILLAFFLFARAFRTLFTVAFLA